MLKFDPARVFEAIPEALRFDWMNHKATLDQICPSVRHETSANRTELARRLNNWCVQQTAGKAGTVRT